MRVSSPDPASEREVSSASRNSSSSRLPQDSIHSPHTHPSLNYLDNLKLGVDAVGAAGGVVEAAIGYTGDISDPTKGKFTLDYYLELARQLVAADIHVLCIKDMAGLLKPAAATTLISAIRREFPNLPIHVHTHDTAGTGVASMLACAAAGADAVDAAVDSMSGMTSQPSLGSIVAALKDGNLSTGIAPSDLSALIEYWESVRFSYASVSEVSELSTFCSTIASMSSICSPSPFASSTRHIARFLGNQSTSERSMQCRTYSSRPSSSSLSCSLRLITK